jgi:hypothetical protein
VGERARPKLEIAHSKAVIAAHQSIIQAAEARKAAEEQVLGMGMKSFASWLQSTETTEIDLKISGSDIMAAIDRNKGNNPTA